MTKTGLYGSMFLQMIINVEPFTSEDVARWADISVKTLHSWRAKGVLPDGDDLYEDRGHYYGLQWTHRGADAVLLVAMLREKGMNLDACGAALRAALALQPCPLHYRIFTLSDGRFYRVFENRREAAADEVADTIIDMTE